MDISDINKFEKITAQLEGFHAEISIIAKKSPNDALNSFKLKFINTILIECNELLGITYKPFKDFTQFSDDELPTNSDVTFIISQYIECAEKYRADNIRSDFGSWIWKTNDEDIKIKTAPPKKLNRKD